MRDRLIVAAAVSALLLGNLGAPAFADTASPAVQSAQAPAPADAQVQALFRQLLQDPDNPDLMFAYAQAAAAAGDYDQAIATYERMLIYNPNLPRIRLELGLLYYRQGAPEVGNLYFNQVLASDDVPPAVRRRVQSIMAGAPTAVAARRQWQGALSFGLRYQTNATASPGAGTTVPLASPFGGTVLATLDNAAEADDFNLYVSGSARNLWQMTPETRLETNLVGYAAVYGQEEDLNLFLFEASSGPRFVPFKEADPGLSFRPFLVTRYIHLGQDPYCAAAGGGAELRQVLGRSLTGDARLLAEYRDFFQNDSRPTGNDRDALLSEVDLGGHVLLSPKDRIDLAVYAQRNDADAGSQSYDEWGARAGYAHIFDPPAWLDQPITLSAALAGRWADYDDPDPVIAPGTTREDSEWRVSGAATVGIVRDVNAVLEIEYRNVDSNVPLYAFDDLSVSLGAQLRF